MIQDSCPRPEDLGENPEPATSMPKRLIEAEKKPYTQKGLIQLNQHCKMVPIPPALQSLLPIAYLLAACMRVHYVGVWGMVMVLANS